MEQEVKQRPQVLTVGSGKGGVGKTTTSVNLALSASRQGRTTLLVDADPLSDIPTLLDLEEPEDSVSGKASGEKSLKMPLEKLAVPVFSSLSLLVPPGEKTAAQSAGLIKKLFSAKESDFLNSFSLVILDLPAGTMEEEGLGFLKKADQVVVVTNDEPTSHVAAGAFIKAASEVSSKLPFKIWHNKYRGISNEGFDPQDLPGNYNRNVAEEDRLDFSRLNLTDTAYIPQDTSLDLLQSSPDLNLNIKRQMLERIELIYRQRISQVLRISRVPPRLSNILENYLYSLDFGLREEKILAVLGEELKVLLAGAVFSPVSGQAGGDILKEKEIFSPEERRDLGRIIKILKEDNLSVSIRRLKKLLESLLEEEENSQRLFYQEKDIDRMKTLDRELGLFLALLAGKFGGGGGVNAGEGLIIKNLGGLLLYDFALFKLFKSDTIRKLIIGFIPWRENSRGKKIRDKNRQIRWLVEDDGEYRKRFLALVKTLFPVLLSQLKAVAQALDLKNLVFQKEKKLNQEVYLRLLTSFLHDVLNSGLGVVIGFRYRPASRAFQKGAAVLFASDKAGAKPDKGSKAPAPKGKKARKPR